MTNRAIEIGTAGEHIVCADLILLGHRAFLVAAGLPYDIIADVRGHLFRIAVKSTSAARSRPAREGSRICYQFAVGRRRSPLNGRTLVRAYQAADVDIVALVALDSRAVAYVAIQDCKTSMHLDAPGEHRGTNRFGPKTARCKRFDDFPLARALARFGQ